MADDKHWFTLPRVFANKSKELIGLLTMAWSE
jgi:hypothetical protein